MHGGGNYGLTHSALSSDAKETHEALKWSATIDRKEVLILTDSTQLIDELSSKTANNIPMVWTIADFHKMHLPKGGSEASQNGT